MIKSFRDARTRAIRDGKPLKGVPSDVFKRAVRKLALLDPLVVLEDPRVPPGNHLEALRGDRAGQYAIRVNEQWRICFVWRDGDAYDVEFADYH